MFKNIIQFFNKLKKSEKEESKSTAKERLHLVLAQDRANISADFSEGRGVSPGSRAHSSVQAVSQRDRHDHDGLHPHHKDGSGGISDPQPHLFPHGGLRYGGLPQL